MADDFISGFLAGQGDGNSNRGGMFGGDGWWAIIIFALIFGWGRGGYGAGNGAGDGGSTGTGAAMAGYVLTSDFANLERKLDGVNNGICDGFYAMNTGMLNGFAGVTQAVTGGFSAAELARCNQQAALMQQLNAMQMQAQECCCENRAAIAQVRYDMATQACDTRNTVQVAARDIIDSQNAGTRAVLDFLTNSRLRDLEAENSTLKLAASQAAQNNYLVNTLRPAPIPAYQVQNPYSYGANGCGGCGGCGNY
jgi:hypothetical protein|nr:MAG TPA: hypothetical protein [Caudoviricetes sp.]